MKLLPGNETVLLIPAYVLNGVPQLIGATGTSAPIGAPTKAVLDSWIPKTTPQSPAILGGNVSQAIRDDMKLGLTGSGKSTSRSITSIGKGESLTYFNFQAQFNFFREGDTTAAGKTSAFALAKNLTRVQGIPYVIAHRLGAPQTSSQTTLVTLGEDWSFYYALTGQPIPGYGDNEEQTIGSTFVPKNIVNIAYAIAS